MKILAKLALIVTALALLARPGFVAGAGAQASFVDFTGTESCVPVDFGSWSYPAGNPHVRDLVLDCTESSTTTLMHGQNTVVLSGNLLASPFAFLGGVGPISGTWTMDTWTGTWQGQVDEDGVSYHAQGTGRGPNEGMKIWMDTTNEQFTGRILLSARY